MKLQRKVIDHKPKAGLFGRKQQDAEEPEAQDEGSGGVANWLSTDPNKIRGAASAAKFMSGANRPPEIWVKEGTSKVIRFRDNAPIASFGQYSTRIAGKFRSFVAPGKGQVDLFATHAGLRQRPVFVYEVLDVEGYLDKQNKRLTNQSKFWVVGVRLYEQLQAYADETGELLSDVTLKVKRTGSGTSTSYMLFKVDDAELTEAQRKVPRLKSKLTTYYKPPTLAEQKALLPSLEATDGD